MKKQQDAPSDKTYMAAEVKPRRMKLLIGLLVVGILAIASGLFMQSMLITGRMMIHPVFAPTVLISVGVGILVGMIIYLLPRYRNGY